MAPVNRRVLVLVAVAAAGGLATSSAVPTAHAEAAPVFEARFSALCCNFSPLDIDIDPEYLYVVDTASRELLLFDYMGKHVRSFEAVCGVLAVNAWQSEGSSRVTMTTHCDTTQTIHMDSGYVSDPYSSSYTSNPCLHPDLPPGPLHYPYRGPFYAVFVESWLLCDGDGDSTLRLTTDAANHLILIHDIVSNHERTFGTYGNGSGQFDTPRGIVLNPTHIFVADAGNDRVQVFDRSWNCVGMFAANHPVGLALSTTHLFVTEPNHNRIRAFSLGNYTEAPCPQGTAPGNAAAPAVCVESRSWSWCPQGTAPGNAAAPATANPVGVLMLEHCAGDVRAIDSGSVRATDAKGAHAGTFGLHVAGPGQFCVTLNISHNTTHIFVTDGYFNRTQIFDLFGNHTGTIP